MILADPPWETSGSATPPTGMEPVTHLLGQAGRNVEGADEADSGAVTLIQRCGSAANLNIHLHCLVLDGVYRRGIDGTPEFVEAPAPTDEALSKRCCARSSPA